jgi:5-methylcytosine-specific restriction protein A
MSRNPNWSRDELILALDLYFRVDVAHISHNDKDVIELSKLLNSLDIHPTGIIGSDFRNPNSVYMKLCNFLRFDPEYTGVGLPRGSRLDEVIWNEFSDDGKRLADTAESIRENAELVAKDENADLMRDIVDDESFAEGRLLERVHKARERNASLVRRKKNHVMNEQNRLICEACGFDFEVVYGELGHGFAECHHLIPLTDLRYDSRTSLRDLAIVCANCHRMIHRGRPMLSIKDLRELIG